MKILRTIMDYLCRYHSSLGHLLGNEAVLGVVCVCVCVSDQYFMYSKKTVLCFLFSISQIDFIVIKFHCK